MRAAAEPFKIMANLYFVGVANGESYLLTSPQGHILFGASFDDTTDQIEKNNQAMGFLTAGQGR
jgi:metallo-beta-lactamase class B